jgi:N-formylglutamate deformylase
VYPFLVSVPHGGDKVPDEVSDRIALGRHDILYYSDPLTRTLYDFNDHVAGFIDTPISRVIVDLNRPPHAIPPHYPDGVIKHRTVDGRPIYKSGQNPDHFMIQHLLLRYYFPYHAKLDMMLDPEKIMLALDCHSMLPFAPLSDGNTGAKRPLICIGNNGNTAGRPKRKNPVTCSSELVNVLARSFREEFPGQGCVAVNDPYPGGFISNFHFWQKGIPWIQIEINRVLYEADNSRIQDNPRPDIDAVFALRKRIWHVLEQFRDSISDKDKF